MTATACSPAHPRNQYPEVSAGESVSKVGRDGTTTLTPAATSSRVPRSVVGSRCSCPQAGQRISTTLASPAPSATVSRTLSAGTSTGPHATQFPRTSAGTGQVFHLASVLGSGPAVVRVCQGVPAYRALFLDNPLTSGRNQPANCARKRRELSGSCAEGSLRANFSLAGDHNSTDPVGEATSDQTVRREQRLRQAPQ